MSWFEALTGRNTAPVAVVPPAAAPYGQRATSALDALATSVRAASTIVSPTVFSQLRSIDDIVRPLITHIATHPVIIDTQLSIDAIITDYVPTTLALFLRLPASERAIGGKSDLMLQEQFTTLERSAHDISARVYRDSISALETNAIFIQTKFGA
jgi:hypothetical protein